MGRFGGSSVAEFAPQVAQSLNKDAVYFVTLGLELQWLSQVLPAAAQGDWSPYNSTGTVYRQSMRQHLLYFNQLYQLTSVNPQNLALIDNMVTAFVAQIDPLIEQQIVVLAVTNLG
jgi:phosphoribulokinase